MSWQGREFLRLLWVIPPALTFTGLVGTINVVSGSSMQPALNPDGPHQRDMVWVDRWNITARRRYRRGDVVSLKSPLDPNLIIVKRILALGGDVVSELVPPEQKMPEQRCSQVDTLPPYPDKQVRIPDGYAWVEGE
ncbi:hypothetical protein FRC08_001549 [Ceratobasidium sp. 394]|nr:hypothetical protein FRC08_001549 [Ceratobasidium sp. 394]